MVGAERAFVAGERALIESFGFRVIAFVPVERGEIIDGRGGVWMIRAFDFFENGERAAHRRFGARGVALFVVEYAEVA